MPRDANPTIWQAEQHTLAKHAILEAYLKAWFSILGRQSQKVAATTNEILYVDGFAGPGAYAKGEDGSPILALRTAIELAPHTRVPIRFVFIEEDAERHAHLEMLVESWRPLLASHPHLIVEPPIKGVCEEKLSGLIDERVRAGRRFGPAMVFLDQCGYSQVSTELIGRILRIPQCEVFSLLEYRDLNRFLSDESKHSGLTRAFGGETWRPCATLGGRQRQDCVRNAYVAALRDRAQAKFVQSFSMHDAARQILYWLFFSTNHIRGLEEMKKAMWTVDRGGTFRFSDASGEDQARLLGAFDATWLAEKLAELFAGRTATVQEVYNATIEKTPCVKYKEALRILERTGRAVPVDPPAGRPKGTYKDETLRLTFN